LTKISMND